MRVDFPTDHRHFLWSKVDFFFIFHRKTREKRAREKPETIGEIFVAARVLNAPKARLHSTASARERGRDKEERERGGMNPCVRVRDKQGRASEKTEEI